MRRPHPTAKLCQAAVIAFASLVHHTIPVAAQSAASIEPVVVPTETSSGATAGTTERHGDWDFVCVGQTAPQVVTRPARCRITQNHATPTGHTVLLVTLLYSDAARGPVAVVSVPKGVYLAPGIELKVDNGTPFKLLYETCDESGCHAGYKVTGDVGLALKKGHVAVHKLFDSKQKPVAVDVSLKGLSKALDRLAEVSR
jgi:invasion protein IalB